MIGLPIPSSVEKKLFLKDWYQAIADKYGEDTFLIFMNYGYANLNSEEDLKLDPGEEKDRYPMQMYHHVACAVPLDDRKMLEVGCGRGGGAAFVARHFYPQSLTGVDFSQKAIRQCKKHHSIQNLNFLVGDAERLPFEDASFDVTINVESSHCYASTEKFLNEVFRITRPQGYLVLADFRACIGIDELRRYFFGSGWKLIEERNITANVMKSLDLEHERKLEFILKMVPEEYHPDFIEFAGLKGTFIYQGLLDGRMKYVRYIVQK